MISYHTKNPIYLKLTYASFWIISQFGEKVADFGLNGPDPVTN